MLGVRVRVRVRIGRLGGWADLQIDQCCRIFSIQSAMLGGQCGPKKVGKNQKKIQENYFLPSINTVSFIIL
jgi:hypothetical protein